MVEYDFVALVEHCSSCAANISSAGQEIPRIL